VESLVELFVGLLVGSPDGLLIGSLPDGSPGKLLIGSLGGSLIGSPDGLLIGSLVGLPVPSARRLIVRLLARQILVGSLSGSLVGSLDGLLVGSLVGLFVDSLIGSQIYLPPVKICEVLVMLLRNLFGRVARLSSFRVSGFRLHKFQ
jgi:hypothetical protein